jgi:hypothetical protein
VTHTSIEHRHTNKPGKHPKPMHNTQRNQHTHPIVCAGEGRLSDQLLGGGGLPGLLLFAKTHRPSLTEVPPSPPQTPKPPNSTHTSHCQPAMETQAVDWCIEEAEGQEEVESRVLGELKVMLPPDAATGGLPEMVLRPLRMGENRVGACVDDERGGVVWVIGSI